MSKPEKRELVAAWRAAEAALGDPSAVEAAARTLPPRLGVLLRALETVDAGDPHAIADLARACRDDHPDVAALLDLLDPAGAAADVGAPSKAGADRPSEAAPTPPRWADVPETVELPFRDVLTAFSVARTGRPGPSAPRLDVAARYRPVLHAVHRLLVDDRDALFTNPVIAAFSPRADQLQMAGRAAQMLGHAGRSALAAHLGEAMSLHLDPARWPELEDRAPGDLGRWGRTRAPWVRDHDEAVAALLAPAGPPGGERAEADSLAPLHHALGAILRRVARDVPLGRLAGMARPVRAAFNLAWRLDPDSDLTRQIAALQLRLDRFDPEVRARSGQLLLALHAATPPRLRAAERAALARESLAEPHDVVSPAERKAAALALMAWGEDEEAAEALLAHARQAPPAALISDLQAAGTPKPRLIALMGLHAASHGYAKPALGAVERLARDGIVGMLPPLTRALAAALNRADADLPADVPDALAAAVDALSQVDAPEAWLPWLSLPAVRARVDDRVRATLDAQLLGAREAPADAEDARGWAARLLAADALDGDAGSVVRDLGRALRPMPETVADALVWRVLGHLTATAPARATELLHGAAAPLARRLARRDGAPARDALAALDVRGTILVGAVDALFRGGLDAPPGPWRARLSEALDVAATADPAARAALQAATEHAQLDGARTLADAAGLVHAHAAARLDAPAPAHGALSPLLRPTGRP